MSISEHIPINDKLRNLGVAKFVKQGDLVQIIVSKQKVISFNIHPKEFQRTMERFRKSALNSTAGLSEKIINKMERVLVHPDNGYVKYLQLNGNSKAKNNNESDIRNLNQTYATVYADKTSLYEAIIIGEIPIFAKISSSSSRMISLYPEVQIDEDNIILPLPSNLYASRPYEFGSEKEFRKIEHQVKSKNLDSLFQKVKAQWNLYIDNGKEHNIMCAGDTIFTYYQDILGTTHYDFFVGDNGTGKTNNLHLFNLLAYRNVLSSEMTAPNIYQLLGNDKHGVVTI
jgi:hypothetical protein